MTTQEQKRTTTGPVPKRSTHGFIYVCKHLTAAYNFKIGASFNPEEDCTTFPEFPLKYKCWTKNVEHALKQIATKLFNVTVAAVYLQDCYSTFTTDQICAKIEEACNAADTELKSLPNLPPIDIQSATAATTATLQQIPYVTEEMANKIVAASPILWYEQLEHIPKMTKEALYHLKLYTVIPPPMHAIKFTDPDGTARTVYITAESFKRLCAPQSLTTPTVVGVISADYVVANTQWAPDLMSTNPSELLKATAEIHYTWHKTFQRKPAGPNVREMCGLRSKS